MPGIVVGIDGSTCSDMAVAEAAVLATELGEKLFVVFGYEPWRGGGEIQDHRLALEDLGHKVGGAAVEQAKEVGAEAELKLVDRGSVDALLTTADAVDARMIVVGSYGDSPLRGAILGSTPHKLVHLSKRPVLVVHGADE
ncbi:MAG: universal stress protein [Solirubrobacterales bacterium]|nr:universal stress protein [Solirubrobacterales bacterium]